MKVRKPLILWAVQRRYRFSDPWEWIASVGRIAAYTTRAAAMRASYREGCYIGKNNTRVVRLEKP